MKTEEIKNEEEKNSDVQNKNKKVDFTNDVKDILEAQEREGEEEQHNENDFQLNDENHQEENEKSENEEESKEEPFNFRKKLLTTEEHRTYGNRLREDYVYDNEGENGIFEADPRVVRIAGFELNKKVTTKIKIINKSKFSERIIILPPTTPFFKIRYNKRGQIAPGLSEVIFLYFTPQNYQYYTDNICINCPGGKIIIPIHAFPKMNVHVKEYVPKMIDLGNITIETTEKKDFVINNIIDIPFKFQITPLNECEEITLNPLMGEIKPFETQRFNISITPKKFGIYRGEYEFKVNEVDYQPQKFEIFATCKSYDTNNLIEEAQKISKEEMLKKYSKNVLPQNQDEEFNEENPMEDTNKKEDEKVEEAKTENLDPEMNDIIKTNKLSNEDLETKSIKTQILPTEKKSLDNFYDKDGGELKQKQQEDLNESNASELTRPESKMLSRFKNFPSNKEREYLNTFNDIDGQIKAKEFKYIRFIGKVPLTEEQSQKILDDREKDKNKLIDMECQMDKNRHEPECDKEKCEVDRDQKFYQKPNFSTNQNDNFFKARHYIKLFLKAMTKIIYRKRADDRLNKLNDLIKKNNIKNRDDFIHFCDQDWINYFSQDQQGGNDESQFNFMQMKFLPPSHLYRETIWLNNEISLNSLKQKITHENNINLEKFVEYEPLEKHDIEIVKYESFNSPGLTQFDINMGEKPFRPSCQSENLIRSERGDSELNPSKYENLFEISDCHLKHIFSNPEDLIFQNPILKKYSPLPLYNETSIDYNLQPRIMKNAYLPLSSYSNDIYMKINFNYEDSEKINNKLIESDPFFIDTSMSLENMKKLKAPDEKDLIVKHGINVDEDNYIFEMEKDDDKAILDMIEKDDDKVKNMRELNKISTYDVRKDEKIKFEKKMEAIKKKWMSLVPTYFEYINSGIKHPNNKLLP
jgi:hypothetical protein